MPYVTIDVDLDDIDTEDLVDEVCSRLRKDGSRKSLTAKHKKELRESLADMIDLLGLSPTDIIEIKTLDDKIKYEHLALVFSKYPSYEIEKALP